MLCRRIEHGCPFRCLAVNQLNRFTSEPQSELNLRQSTKNKKLFPKYIPALHLFSNLITRVVKNVFFCLHSEVRMYLCDASAIFETDLAGTFFITHYRKESPHKFTGMTILHVSQLPHPHCAQPYPHSDQPLPTLHPKPPTLYPHST